MFRLALCFLLLHFLLLLVHFLEFDSFFFCLLVGQVAELRRYLFALHFLDILMESCVLLLVFEEFDKLFDFFLIRYEFVGQTVLAGDEFAGKFGFAKQLAPFINS